MSPGLRISRPRNMLSAIDSAGDMARFWYTVSMPGVARLASGW